MGFISTLFGRKPEIVTKTVRDPVKEAVANPLSRFIESQVGQGVPRFDDRITGEFPEGSLNSASEFLKINPRDFFNENIKGPAIETFEEQLAISKEDFAGRLSGSGRFRTQEDQINRFTRDLASTQAQFELELPQRQFEIARAIKQEDDKEAILQYQDWLKSLPIYNPVLEQGLRFLSDSTSTGRTVLSGLDSGSSGIIGDILGAIAKVAASG